MIFGKSSMLPYFVVGINKYTCFVVGINVVILQIFLPTLNEQISCVLTILHPRDS